MNLETTGFKKSLYNSVGELQISGSVNLPDSDSWLEVGVSGNSTTKLRFSDSKIYDNSGRLISHYKYGEPSDFVLNTSLSRYDFFVGGRALVLGELKSATGYDEYLIVNCSGDVQFDYYANSDKPEYSVTEEIVTNSTSGNLTGYIVNLSSKAFKLYDVDTTADLFTITCNSGSVAPLGSGSFTLTRSPDYTGGYMSVPLRIYTNFGILNESVSISGAYSDSNNFSIAVAGPESVRNGYQNSYLGNVFSISGLDPFSIYLNHVSGSGQFTQLTGFSGIDSNAYSGNLTGSGYLTCVKSATLTGQSVTGSIAQTMSATGTIFSFATGAFSKTYLVTCYGIATGIGYTGYSSGYVNYVASGTCPSGYAQITASVTGAPSGLAPIELVTQSNATGAIYYNVPISGVTSDILYVGNSYAGIVFGFHYSSIFGLASYLNSNKPTHRVTASVSGANTVLLSSDEGYEGNFTLLDVDDDNDGSMSVSGPTLQGGSDTAFLGTVYASGNFTGALSELYTHTGSYNVVQTGYLIASGQSPYLIRNFYDIWDFSTGYSAYSMVNFLDAGATGSGGYLKSGISDGLFYCSLDYANHNQNFTDIVELTITGGGKYQTIRITGVE